MTDLQRSHTELRAILRLAGRELTKLGFGKRDTPLLRKMREILQDARAVARATRR